MNLLKPLQAIHSEALDPTGGHEVLTGMIDVLMAEVDRAQSGANGLFINMTMTHKVEDLQAENERLKGSRSAYKMLQEDIHELTFERNQLAEENDRLRADAGRYRWLSAYLVSPDTQHDDAIVDTRTKDELDSVIDAARKGTP